MSQKTGENELVRFDDIKNRIFTIRGVQVMLDRDLAELYGVETKRLNEQVRRNLERFPYEFSFVLTRSEYDSLRSHFATLETGKGKHKKYLPRVFSEYGVMMLSNVLKSDTASKISISIVKAFVSLRRYLKETSEIFQRFNIIEKRQIEYEFQTNGKIEKLCKALESKQIQPKQGVFFNGQVFDAHNFVSDLVRSAEKSIVLIDNYVDDAVLTLFAKRKEGVTLKILTKNVTKQLQLDVKKFNEQFPSAEIQEFDLSHDRFMIIDDSEVYHIGASLKNLGKKWFAFSKMDLDSTLKLLMKTKN